MQSFVCLEKNRAIAGPWSSKGCSQEYLGNLPPALTLIILFFTALLNWDSPGSTFPKQRTKGFPWEWGLAMSAQWAVYKLCSSAGWLPFHSLAGEIPENDQAPGAGLPYSSEVALLWVNQESKKFPLFLLRLLQVLQDLKNVSSLCVRFYLSRKT